MNTSGQRRRGGASHAARLEPWTPGGTPSRTRSLTAPSGCSLASASSISPILISTPSFWTRCAPAVLAAGGIEQATILTWTPRLIQQRTPRGTRGRPRGAAARAARALGAVPDRRRLHVAAERLPHPRHLHRLGDGVDPGPLARPRDALPLVPGSRQRARRADQHRAAAIYQRAILELDYAALRDRQRRLVEAIRGRRLRVTTPDGTDLSFWMPRDGWYHCNDGDASREKALGAVCARDREEELPCGAVRSIPAPDSVNGIISLRREHRPGTASGSTSRGLPRTWTRVPRRPHQSSYARATAKPSSTRPGARCRATRTAWARSCSGPIACSRTPGGRTYADLLGFWGRRLPPAPWRQRRVRRPFHSNLWINLFLDGHHDHRRRRDHRPRRRLCRRLTTPGATHREESLGR